MGSHCRIEIDLVVSECKYGVRFSSLRSPPRIHIHRHFISLLLLPFHIFFSFLRCAMNWWNTKSPWLLNSWTLWICVSEGNKESRRRKNVSSFRFFFFLFVGIMQWCLATGSMRSPFTHITSMFSGFHFAQATRRSRETRIICIFSDYVRCARNLNKLLNLHRALTRTHTHRQTLLRKISERISLTVDSNPLPLSHSLNHLPCIACST